MHIIIRDYHMKSRRRNNKDFATKTKGGRKERRKRITKRQFYKGGNKNRIEDSLDRFVAQLTKDITDEFQVGKYHNEFTTIKKLLFYLKEGKYGGYELSHPNAMQKIREDFSKEKGLRLRNPSFFGKYRTLNNTMLTINQLKTRVLSMLVEHENSGGTQIMKGGAISVFRFDKTEHKQGADYESENNVEEQTVSQNNTTRKNSKDDTAATKESLQKGIQTRVAETTKKNVTKKNRDAISSAIVSRIKDMMNENKKEEESDNDSIEIIHMTDSDDSDSDDSNKNVIKAWPNSVDAVKQAIEKGIRAHLIKKAEDQKIKEDKINTENKIVDKLIEEKDAENRKFIEETLNQIIKGTKDTHEALTDVQQHVYDLDYNITNKINVAEIRTRIREYNTKQRNLFENVGKKIEIFDDISTLKTLIPSVDFGNYDNIDKQNLDKADEALSTSNTKIRLYQKTIMRFKKICNENLDNKSLHNYHAFINSKIQDLNKLIKIKITEKNELFTKINEAHKKLSIDDKIKKIKQYKINSVDNMEQANQYMNEIKKQLKDKIKNHVLTSITGNLTAGKDEFNKDLESLSQIFDKKKSNYDDENRIDLKSRIAEMNTKNASMVKLANIVSNNINSYTPHIKTIEGALKKINKKDGIYEKLFETKGTLELQKRMADYIYDTMSNLTEEQKSKLDGIRNTITENVKKIDTKFADTEKDIKEVTELVKNSEETLEKAQKTLEKAKETLKNAEKVKNEINRQVDEENKKFTTFVKNAATKNSEIENKLTEVKTLFKEATDDILDTARKNTTDVAKTTSSAIHQMKNSMNKIAKLQKDYNAIIQKLEKKKQFIMFKETLDENGDELEHIEKTKDAIQEILNHYREIIQKNQALAREKGHAFDTKKSIVATYEQNMNYRREIYLLKEMAIERESTFDGRIRMARRFKLISYFYAPIRGIKEALKKGGIDTDGYYSKIMPYANTIIPNSGAFQLLLTLNFILARVLIRTPAYYLNNSGGGRVRDNVFRKLLGYKKKTHDEFKKEIKDTMKTASEGFETIYGMTPDVYYKNKKDLFLYKRDYRQVPPLLFIEDIFRIAAIATILSVEFSAAIVYLVLGPFYVRAKSDKTKDLESLIKTISEKGVNTKEETDRLNILKQVQEYSRDFDKLFSTIPEKVKKIANPEELLNDELSQTVSYYGNLLSYLRVIAKGKSDDKLEKLIVELEEAVENLIEEYSTLLFYFYGNRDIINRGELLLPEHEIVCKKLKGVADKVSEANENVKTKLGDIVENGRYQQKEDEIRTIVDNSFQVYMMGDSPFKNTISGTSYRNSQDALQGAIEPTSNYLFPKNLEKPLQYFKELVKTPIDRYSTEKLSLNDTNTGEKYYGNKFKKTFDSITKYAKTQLEKEKQERDKTKNETEKALFTIVKSISDDMTNYNTDENGEKITYKDKKGDVILCPESENMGGKKAIEIKKILEQEYSMNMPLFVRTIVLVKFMGDTNWKKGNKVSLFSQHFTRFVEHYIKNMTRFIKIFEQIAEEEPNLTMEEFSDKFKRLIATFIQKINDEDYKTLKSFVVSASKKQATINVNFPVSRTEPKTELHKQYYYALTELLEKAYDHKKTQNTFVPDLINILRNFHSSLCMTDFNKDKWVGDTKPYSLTDFKKLFTTKDYDAYSKKQLSMWRTIWKDKTLETVNRGIEALILKTDKISKLAQKIDEESLKIGEDALIGKETIDNIFEILELKTQSIFETRDLTTYGIKLDKAQTYYVNCVLNLCLVINHFIGQIQSGFQSHFPTRYLKEYIDYSIRAGKHEGDQPNIIETGLDNIKKYNYYVKMMYINTCVDSLLQKEEEKTPIYYFKKILQSNGASNANYINTELTVTINFSWPENIVRIVNNLGDDSAELTQLLTLLFNQLDYNNISKIINASPDPQYLQKVLNHLNYNDERMRNTAVSLEECLWPYIYDTTLKSHTTEILWQRGIEKFTPLLIYRLVSITDTTNMVKLITNYEADNSDREIVKNNILTVFKKMFNDKKKESSPLQLSQLSNYDDFQIKKRKISNQSYAIDNVNRAKMRGVKQSGGNSTKQYTLRDALDAIFGSANEQNQNIPLIILILHTLMTSNPDQEISGQEIMSKIIEELYENPKNYIAIGRIRGILTKNEDDLESVFDNKEEKLHPFKPTIDTGSLDAHVLPDEALVILNKIPKIDPVEPLTSTTLKKAKEEVDKNNQELKQKREEKEKKLSEGEQQYRGTLYDLVTTDSGNATAIQDEVYNIHKEIMNNPDEDFPKHDLVAHLIDFLEPENLEIYPSEKSTPYKKDNPGQETRRQIIQDRLVKENTDMYVDPVISNVVNTFIPTADAIPIKQDPPSIIQKTTEYLTKLYPTTYFLNNSEDDNKTETYGKRVTKQKDTYKNGSKISFDMLNLDNNLNMLWNTGANLEYADSYKPKFQELYSIEENVSAAHANPPSVAPASK